MQNDNKLVKSAIYISTFTLVSKFLGFLREVLLASKFGSGFETDSYFIALTATSLFSSLISNAISTTYIPVFYEIEKNEGYEGKIWHTNNLINAITLISLFLMFLTYALMPILIKILAKDFSLQEVTITASLAKYGLPSILISGVIGVLTGFRQSESKFIATAIMGIPFNLVYIIFFLLFAHESGIKGLMITGVIAYFTQILIQVPEAKASKFKYKFILDLKDKYIGRLISLSTPVIIGVAINDINNIIDKTIASGLESGSISSLNYAFKLNSLIYTVFITAITTVFFPLLSKNANDNNFEELKNNLFYGIDLILLLTLPATVGMMVLASPIVQIAFQRGEFDAIATLMTSEALAYYSFGLVGMSVMLLLTKVFYSLQDTKTPMIASGVSVVINIILNIILSKYMGHAGLALATSIAMSISCVFLLLMFKYKIGSLGFKYILTELVKIGMASLSMGILAYITYYRLIGKMVNSDVQNLVALVMTVCVSILVYGILCKAFKVKGIDSIFGEVKSRISH